MNLTTTTTSRETWKQQVNSQIVTLAKQSWQIRIENNHKGDPSEYEAVLYKCDFHLGSQTNTHFLTKNHSDQVYSAVSVQRTDIGSVVFLLQSWLLYMLSTNWSNLHIILHLTLKTVNKNIFKIYGGREWGDSVSKCWHESPNLNQTNWNSDILN